MAEKQLAAAADEPHFDTRAQIIRKVTWVGLFINLGLAVIKFSAGIWGRSQALVADAIHSLTDLTTDAAVIAGSHYWERPPDDDHPYGHKRLETLVTVFIGIMLAAAGIGIGWKAISSLHQENAISPGWLALLAVLVSIILKEGIYRWTARTGKRIKSAALAANAWHHRTDALSSLPVFIAVGGAKIFPSWSFLDRVGAVVVSIFILHAAVKIIWPSLAELIDAGAPVETRKRIRQIAHENENVLQVHDIRTRYISTSIQVDLHIVVEGSLTVRQGHDIADDVRNRISAGIPEILDVIVHVDPPERANQEMDLH
ncbi:MAG: cation diffusion facilitator family transporter [Desulfobacterales bacterium]|nr:cation diffusion facilitator family transporter [Desulfobacterales bacterium]